MLNAGKITDTMKEATASKAIAKAKKKLAKEASTPTPPPKPAELKDPPPPNSETGDPATPPTPELPVNTPEVAAATGVTTVGVAVPGGGDTIPGQENAERVAAVQEAAADLKKQYDLGE